MAQLKDVNLLSFGNTIHLAGAVYLGENQVFLVPLPEYSGTLVAAPAGVAFYDDKSGEEHNVDVLDLSREDWKTFMRQTDIMETEILQAAGEDGKIAKAIVRKSQRQISQDVSWRVFRRDGFKCRYCGADDCPLTVDHLVLWEEGGPSIEENLVAADKNCNSRRGNLPYDQWLESPYYKKVSQNLTQAEREENRRIAGTLHKIPRMIHKPKHR